MLKPKTLFPHPTSAETYKGKLETGVLRSWRSLAKAIQGYAPPEVLRMWLLAEANGRARPQMMRRIITRLATLERNRLYKLLNIKTK